MPTLYECLWWCQSTTATSVTVFSRMGTISFQPAICFQIYFASYSVLACPFLRKAFKQPTTEQHSRSQRRQPICQLDQRQVALGCQAQGLQDEETAHKLTEAGWILRMTICNICRFPSMIPKMEGS